MCLGRQEHTMISEIFYNYLDILFYKMFDYIKETFKKGAKLKLICLNGEFSGEVLSISEDSIILKTFEGVICGIKGKDISFFEEVELSSTNHEKSSILETIYGEVSSSSQQIVTEESTQNNTSSTNDKEENNEKETQTQNTAISSSLKENESIGIVNKPKVVGFIDLETIKKSSKGIPLNTSNNKLKPESHSKKTFTSFEDLSILLDDEHKKQNEKYVPALGEIKKSRPDRNFGFITDGKTGKDLYFSFNQLVDPSIDKSSVKLAHIPVVYSIQGSKLTDIALTIHRPNKIIKLIEFSQKLVGDGEFKHATRILEHILAEYPSNYSADELKRNIEKNNPQIKYKKYPNLYNKAKKYQSAKDYPKAIEYFIKAIEERVKLESSIKDLGALYAQLYKQGGTDSLVYKEKFIELIANHKQDLPDSISTLYYLENLYYSIQEYERFILVAKELLDEKELQYDKNRRYLLLCKIAAAYIQAGEKETALETIEEVLSSDPNNIGALKLKAAIESNDQENIIEAISATQFDSLTSGLSPFIQQTLDEYDEYKGVTAKKKETMTFNKTTLREVRELIEQFIGRAKDRAPYLLTEAKLMLDIEPENTLRLRTILARYCFDMAKTHIADNSPLDVVRFYFIEAFSLEENYDNIAQNIAYFLFTHIYDYRELLQVIAKDISIDYALKKTITLDLDFKIWINILSMFLYNRVISARLTSVFYSNKEYKTKAIDALNKFNVSIETNPSKESFTEAWNNAREKLKLYNSSIIASIRTILNSQSLEEIYDQLQSLNNLNKDWMFALDINRLKWVIDNIVPAISSYLKSSGYRNKEANRNNAYGQINQLIEEIKKEPTKLSYEEFLPLLDTLAHLLADSFNEVVKLSEPRISIRLLSEQTVVNDNGVVNIQVEVANHKDSSPIKEVSLSIDDTEDLQLLNGGEVFYNAIEGGESHIFKLQFEVGSDIIQQKATAVTIYCNYLNGNNKKQVSNQLSLKLYSQEEFTPIENPYAPIADGGPVPLDSKMFYGRETEIENIVDAIIKSSSKQIIIYGQKRSGKSSVMLHLKQILLNTGKTFCVFFSLGDIINSLSEASFYYKIISSIKQELEFLEMDEVEDVPAFEIPSAKEFKEEDEDNPLNTFTKYMIKFKMSCKQTKGWENKNLVVMIDEFTYLYTEIKKNHISPSIMKQWKAITQNERAQFSVVLVGQDVVPSFKKEDYARNAFGVIQDMRLTYLKDEPARALIEKPILDKDGNSRYIGEAVSRIIEYTSRNPYYIQIFCSRLVDYMNKNKSIRVTEADVNEVARSFIYGSEALEEDKFDNLIRAGESEDLQEYPESEILAVLRQIALSSKNVGYCNRADIDIIEDKGRENAIIKDLCDREVLEPKGENSYKIQVKLFQEWLLNH